MNTNTLLAKNEDPKEITIARIIPIHFIYSEKGKHTTRPAEKKETLLFYTKPIFKARKYELF